MNSRVFGNPLLPTVFCNCVKLLFSRVSVNTDKLPASDCSVNIRPYSASEINSSLLTRTRNLRARAHGHCRPCLARGRRDRERASEAENDGSRNFAEELARLTVHIGRLYQALSFQRCLNA